MAHITDVKLTVRLPRELLNRLAEAANAERRSMNAHLIVLLEQALGKKARS